MRGALVIQLLCILLFGIIPADAGSTCSRPAGSRRPEDHPRGCGEHPLGITPVGGRRGSSPRMRGARVGTQPQASGPGIIPADAGSTVIGLLSSSRS